MSMKSIRDYYGVPAKRGGSVLYDGQPGRILSACRSAMHLRVRLETGERVILHPTWRMEYL